ncbi:MAG: DUF1844 domain-containing protein [Candidatus Coatesbacteria bacterium]|nr:DUF1844 domain-containing protein [Candidatus Coatesbacteria bacterium]
MAEGNADQEKKIYTQTLLGLVQSIAAAGMAQLGKMANPLTGKVERNLEQAQSSIAMLEMLKNKTEGNLDKDETVVLDTVLTNLRLNFVEEAKKGETSKAEETKNNRKAAKEKDDTSEQG